VIPEETAQFSVVAGGSPELTYQWQFNGADLNDDAKFSGVTTPQLTVTSITPTEVGGYTVVVRNDAGSITSAPAMLRITPRMLRVQGVSGTPGGTVTVPVQFTSDDGENALRFSLAYDANVLSFVSVAAVPDAALAVTPLGGRVGISLTRPQGVTFTNGQYDVALLTFAIAPGSNALVSTVTFADEPTVRLVTDTNAVALPTLFVAGGVAVLPSGTIALSPGSSLFQQIIRVSNPENAGGTVQGVRIWFHDLGVDSKGYAIRVYNATGTSNGVPYIDYNAPLVPGGQPVNLTVEYYIADRKTVPQPRLVVEFPGLQTFEVPEGTALSATFQIINGNGVMEFSTLAGQIYYVQYAEDAGGTGGWKTALPAITGTGGVVQWIDNGPPKTESAPSEVPSRFYRVLLVTPIP
jgi:hypothetical protein